MKTALCVLTKDYLELLKDLDNPPILEDILNLPLTMQSRETCESDANFLQLLPYAAIEVMGKGLSPCLLTYRRPVTGTEGRLHGAMSVGFGGHVDTMPSGVPLLTHLFEELKRELKEELGLTLKANGDTILGLGLAAGFSTSFWKIHGWLERQAFFRRTVGLGVFMNGILPAPLTWPGAIRTIRARRGVAPRRCRRQFESQDSGATAVPPIGTVSKTFAA